MKRHFLSFILLSYGFTHSISALDQGSERFTEFMEGTSPYATLVDIGKNSSVNSNLLFTDTGYVGAIAAFPFPNGTGQKYEVANMMNFQGNYNWAAAKTDPRSSAFIINSMDRLSTNPQAEIELVQGITESKLNASQAGELANKYIASEIITPNVGYYQTADNQESFESAYDNVMLGQAEEALFKGDEASSLEYFNNKQAEFKNNTDKQNSAGSFQKDGLMRSKNTAETFRDFFQLKSMVSQQNLAAMPTESSLLNNCQNNTPKGANQNAVYNASMPADEISFYNLTPPSYPFDFCEQYMHMERSFLIQNEPVRGQLETLISDSDQMASGLNEISEKLSDQSLEVEQIANVLSTNPAWKTLTERAKAYKECEKKDCLKKAEAVFSSMVRYPGFEKHQSQSRREIQSVLTNIKQTGSMPGEARKIVDKIATQNPSLESKSGVSSGSKSKTRKLKSMKAGPEDNAASEESGIASKSLSGLSDSYKKRSYTDSVYYRDEEGVLRGPSGKPIQGNHSSKDKDLFEIISHRYLIQVQQGSIDASQK